MSISSQKKAELRRRRHARVRKKVAGTAERPRLAVFRSARHISAQIIDDTSGRTLAAASTVEPAVRSGLAGGAAGVATGNKTAAAAVGRVLAERARAAGISGVVFDRGGFLYHGRVASLADAAREAGLEF